MLKSKCVYGLIRSYCTLRAASALVVTLLSALTLALAAPFASLATVAVISTVAAIETLSTVSASASAVSPTVNLGVSRVVPGIEVLISEQRSLVAGKRVGLISNQTGVTSTGESDVEAMLHAGVQLVALYAPEHGWRGGAEAGAKVGDTRDAATGLPVYSLYGSTRKPTSAMLKNIDILIFDIQDVGARYYTYVSTMAYAMEAARDSGIQFMVLDRPNPISGTAVEGPKMESRFASFVGLYPYPIRHGLTVGELASLINNEYGIHANLKVVPMRGWRRDMWFDETGLPWVAPSPNMRTLATAIVYPGTCLIEGTNVSEGRGTDAPFEQVGAPWVNGPALAQYLNNQDLPGVKFEPVTFTPDSSKFKGVKVQGVRLVIENRNTFQSILTGVHLVLALQQLYPRDFRWLSSSGTFNVDKLWGSSSLRGNGATPVKLVQDWQNDLNAFLALRSRYLLYN